MVFPVYAQDSTLRHGECPLTQATGTRFPSARLHPPGRFEGAFDYQQFRKLIRVQHGLARIEPGQRRGIAAEGRSHSRAAHLHARGYSENAGWRVRWFAHRSESRSWATGAGLGTRPSSFNWGGGMAFTTPEMWGGSA